MTINEQTKVNELSFKEIITTNLKFLREQKKLSQENIADILKVSRQAYNFYESGTRDINTENLKKLATFYGITLDLLVSSSLIDTQAPIIKFTTIEKMQDDIKFSPNLVSISNLNSNLIVYKISDLKFKVYEPNVTNVEGHEMLFELDGKLNTGVIHTQKNGELILNLGDTPQVLTKKQKESLVFIGMLLATVDKEYENSNFF